IGAGGAARVQGREPPRAPRARARRTAVHRELQLPRRARRVPRDAARGGGRLGTKGGAAVGDRAGRGSPGGTDDPRDGLPQGRTARGVVVGNGATTVLSRESLVEVVSIVSYDWHPGQK